MYVSLTLLSTWLCAVTSLITYDKQSQGISSMLSYTIPWNTEKVDFQDNAITNVPAGYFRNLTNLIEITLQDNAVSDVEDFAFINVPTVREIILESNQLSIIRRNMFSGLVNLVSLNLDWNNIHEIQDGSFHNNSALNDLSLAMNQIEIISRCIFHPHNHPTGLDTFIMFGNPLSCNESWCWLKEADSTWITVEYASFTECVGPGVMNGRMWDTLTTTDLNCGTTQETCNTTGMYFHMYNIYFYSG